MKCLKIFFTLACINICYADEKSTGTNLKEDNFIRALNLNELNVVIGANEKHLTGTLAAVITLLNRAYGGLSKLLVKLTINNTAKLDEISENVNIIFAPILANVNDRPNILFDAIINIQKSLHALIYFSFTNASAAEIGKALADITKTVGRFVQAAQVIVATVVLTIASANKGLAESVSALPPLLYTTLDIVLQIILQIRQNSNGLPKLVLRIYSLTIESISRALVETDDIVAGIASSITSDTLTGLGKNLDSVLIEFIATKKFLKSSLSLTALFVAYLNVNTTELVILPDISGYVSDFSIVFKGLFRDIVNNIKKLPTPLKTVQASSTRLGRAVLDLIQYIGNLMMAAGSTIEIFSGTIKAKLQILVEVLTTFASAIKETPASQLNKTVTELLQAVVAVTGFLVNHVNDLHSTIVNSNGTHNLLVELREFFIKLTKYITEKKQTNVSISS